jgi:hypothetical protein
MAGWHSRAELWLSSERLAQDAASDEAFAHVFAALPAIEPSEDFVRRTVQAAWRMRTRRRRATTFVAVAASLLATVTAGVTAYGLLGVASGWLLSTIATVAAGSARLLLVAATTSIGWWAEMTRASSLIAGIVVMPESAFALLAIELAGGGALYALHRLLRAEPGFRDPGPLCL